MGNTATQWFVFYNDCLLLKKTKDNSFAIPCQVSPPCPLPEAEQIHLLDLREHKSAKTFALHSPINENEEWAMSNLRSSFDLLPLEDYQTAGKAYQILYWDKHSRFCPVCGSPMEQRTPIMKQCPACKHETYPPISPAIIVLIRKGKEILLVHARNFKGTFYGLVAGFLEVGETLEQCVRREVMEETGLTIKNITYFGSQPWPYPSGLMVGFIADYDSGTIKLQDNELSAGAFYSRENLPEIPKKLSMARKLIDWWLANN